MQTENLSDKEKNQKPYWVNTCRLLLSALADIVLVMSLLMIISGIFIFAGEKITGEMVFIGKYKPVYIISGSMEPCIKTGAIIIIEKCTYENTDIGDVITFITDSGYVTHRLIGIDENQKRAGREEFLITKGDANNVEDMARTAPSAIKGKTVLCMNMFSVVQSKFQKIKRR